jgi:hypothetical protein
VDAKLGESSVAIATTTGLTLRFITTGANIYTSPATTPLSPTAIHLSSSLFAINAQEGSLQVTTVSLQASNSLASSSVSLPTPPAKGAVPIITPEGYQKKKKFAEKDF